MSSDFAESSLPPSSLSAAELATPPPVFGPPPDSRRVLANAIGQTVGTCSLWWRATPGYRNHRVGLIGQFHAEDSDTARLLLTDACRELRQAGCTLALGPIDGNTWNSYRLVTQSDGAPPFFLEPSYPPEFVGYFLENGFACKLSYYSCLQEHLDQPDPLGDRLAREMQDRGIGLRSLRLENFAAELCNLHALASICFRGHDLYQELPLDDFLRMYRPLQALIDPELLLLAERNSRPVGFAFAIPDILERQRTGVARTLILKTLGVVPENLTTGLGYHLLATLRQRAAAAGFERMILALMRETDYFNRHQRSLGTPFRRYGLFARKLAP